MSNRILNKMTLIIPGLNESDNLVRLHESLRHTLKELPVVEIIYIDDGSTDSTLDLCRKLHLEDPHFHFLAFSRNYGHQYALTAGLDHADGDVTVMMDADLQDPPEVIHEMIRKWEQGADVVYAKRRNRKGESILKKMTAFLFYRLMRGLSSLPLPLDTGDFRLMDRSVVEVLRQFRERNRFLRGLITWMGYRQECVEYDREPRTRGKSHYPFRKMLAFAWDAIAGFSVFPVRIATLLGLAVSTASFALILYYLIRKLVYNDLLEGWTALFLAIMFFGGVQILFIGLLGEYIGKIFDEVKQRPLYLIRESSLPTSRSRTLA